MPSLTSLAILECLVNRLRQIGDSSIVVDETTPFHAPAATAQILYNGATGIALPDQADWKKAYESDSETALIWKMTLDPSMADGEQAKTIHYTYRRYLRQSQIVIDKEGMLFVREALDGSNNYINLQIVPASLHNIVFIAFHANPAGGHFNAWQTRGWSRSHLAENPRYENTSRTDPTR